MQSTSHSASFHVAAIMDGNGRWATRRGLPRVAGHREGARTVRRIVEAAPLLGISTLTLYAMSSDNFGRPPAEVSALLRLFAEYLHRERDGLAERGVRLELIGRRDRLPPALAAAATAAEHATALATARGARLHLRIAIDYSARAELRRALARAAHDGVDPLAGWPDVDLLIRTGGEQRLSDFLLWECAYAELWFTERAWPDFTARDLAAAIDAYRSRERRFGLTEAEPEPVRRESAS
jgi:undecaprenyl diphosphate synthase